MRFNHKSNFVTLLAVFLFLLPLSVIAKDYPEVSKAEHPVFGKQLLEIDPPVETVGAVISPDGTRIASAGTYGNQFFLWNAKTGDRIFWRKLEWNAVPPGSPILFTPDSQFAIYPALETGDESPLDMDISFDVFDAKTGNKLKAVTGGDRSLTPQAWNTASTIAISHDGNRITSGMLSRYAVFSRPDWAIISSADATYYPITALSLSSNGSLVALGYAEGQVEIRDAKTGEIKQTIQAHLSGVSGLIFSNDGKKLFSSAIATALHNMNHMQQYIAGTDETNIADENSVRAWDVSTGNLIKTYVYKGTIHTGTAISLLAPMKKL